MSQQKLIYKFELPRMHMDTREYNLPYFASVIAVMTQHDLPHIWFEFDPELANKKEQKAQVTCIGTGQLVKGYIGKHIGSLIEGPYVWHYYLKSL